MRMSGAAGLEVWRLAVWRTLTFPRSHVAGHRSDGGCGLRVGRRGHRNIRFERGQHPFQRRDRPRAVGFEPAVELPQPGGKFLDLMLDRWPAIFARRPASPRSGVAGAWLSPGRSVRRVPAGVSPPTFTIRLRSSAERASATASKLLRSCVSQNLRPIMLDPLDRARQFHLRRRQRVAGPLQKRQQCRPQPSHRVQRAQHSRLNSSLITRREDFLSGIRKTGKEQRKKSRKCETTKD